MTAPTAPAIESEVTEKLPARIALQVREGALNELIAFDLDIYGTTLAEPGSRNRLVHTADTRQIISALAAAQRQLVLDVRAQADDSEPEFAEANERWYKELAEWVVAP